MRLAQKIFLCLFLLLGSAVAAPAAPVPGAAAAPAGLAPRRPVEASVYQQLPSETEVVRIVVKFHEGTRVRLRGGTLAALQHGSREQAAMAARGLTNARLQADLAAVQAAVAQESLARGLDRLFKQDEALLAQRRSAGEAASGRELADLDLYFEIPLAGGTTHGEVAGLLERLNKIPSIEVAYAEPIFEPAQVPTDPLRGNQGYLNPASQGGIDALYSWGFAGGRGEGIRIVDLEANWFEAAHPDLPALSYAGQLNANVDNHGTQVMGVMLAVANTQGVVGIAHRAQAGYQSTQPVDATTVQNVADAINRAAAGAGAPNGIVLIELQGPGPVAANCTCPAFQCGTAGSVAVEFWQANYDAIATATANGTHVVAAAGNGSANLDHPGYGIAFDRALRDSGAIIVGASQGGTAGAATPACFTNSGSRVDLRGWGAQIATTNNGGGYSFDFGGTSGATPIVAGALADIQGVLIARGRGAGNPRAMRQYLADTGTPQEAATAATRPIGPQPDLRRAIDGLGLGLEGYADGITCQSIWGWAWDSTQPTTRLNVSVFDNGAHYTTVAANQYRADLAAAGKGDGIHAFGVGLPYLQGRHTLSVRYAGTTRNLSFSPRTIYCNTNIFTTQVPASYLAASPGYEVGTQFSSTVGGTVTALRFYKAPGETGSHTLKLWTDGGQQLTSGTIQPASEPASGWVTVDVPDVAITAGTRYRVSVNTNTMQSKTDCGLSPAVTNGPLTAHSGFWRSGVHAFPNTPSCGNFFADVFFSQ